MKVFILWVIFTTPAGIAIETVAHNNEYYGSFGETLCEEDGEIVVQSFRKHLKENERVIFRCTPLAVQEREEVNL